MSDLFTISGHVKTADGSKPYANVPITLNIDPKNLHTQTDASGYYEFSKCAKQNSYYSVIVDNKKPYYTFQVKNSDYVQDVTYGVPNDGIPTPTPVPTTVAKQSRLLVNSDDLVDWSSEHIYIDAIKTARTFGSADHPWDGSPGTLAPNGWPTGNFGATISTVGVGLDGKWNFSCVGHCTKLAAVASAVSQFVLNYDAANNKTTGSFVVGPNASQLFLSFYGNNLSEVKCLRPGYTSDANIFTDKYLSAAAPFGGVRFMDYLKTNSSKVSAWSDRCLPSDPVFSVKGGPYEHTIAFGNLTGKGIWINIPHLATDDFISKLATLVKTTKKPEVPIYVEFSNEVWNGGPSFNQGDDNVAKAIEWAKTNTALKSFLQPMGYNNKDGYRFCRYAEKTVQISKVFKSVGVENVRIVLAGQIGWPTTMDIGLQYIQKFYGNPAEYIYGIAGAPYFGNNTELASRSNLTVDDFFGPYKVTWDGGKNWSTGTNFLLSMAKNTLPTGFIATQHALAKKYNVKSMCYEGGIDLGQVDNKVDVKCAVQLDPRIGPVITSYLTNWFDNGGDEFSYYKLLGGMNKSGYWSLAVDPYSPDKYPKWVSASQVAPKYSVTTTVQPQTGKSSISGAVFGDSDGSKTFTKGDSEGTNRVIRLNPGNLSVISDANSHYSFNNLSAGSYQLTRDYPKGFKMANPTKAGTNIIEITLGANENKTVDIGSTYDK